MTDWDVEPDSGNMVGLLVGTVGGVGGKIEDGEADGDEGTAVEDSVTGTGGTFVAEDDECRSSGRV